MTSEAAGQYECRAVAGLKQISAVTEVRVDEGSLCQERTQSEISLQRVEADPDGRVWRERHSALQGREVTSKERCEVMETGGLRIFGVSRQDMGQVTYTASPSNEVGVASVHISTTVTHPESP